MSDFEQLRDANFERNRQWQGRRENVTEPITASFWGVELAGEVGEACNVVKKLERERMGMPGSRATVEQLAQELADIVICVDLLAMHYGIELGPAVEDKFNETSVKIGLERLLKFGVGYRA